MRTGEVRACMAVSTGMPTSTYRYSHDQSDAAQADEKPRHAVAGQPVRLAATPPYLDSNSHEAVYDIDLAALA